MKTGHPGVGMARVLKDGRGLRRRRAAASPARARAVSEDGAGTTLLAKRNGANGNTEIEDGFAESA